MNQELDELEPVLIKVLGDVERRNFIGGASSGGKKKAKVGQALS
jgi:hypothetical protein